MEYEYFPHPIHLNAKESKHWHDLSKKITLEIVKQNADSKGNRPLSDRVKMLLIQRSRVAKKAAEKITLIGSIISREYLTGERWLVYCEDSTQLGEVLAELRKFNLAPIEYHTGMVGDQYATLIYLKTFGAFLFPSNAWTSASKSQSSRMHPSWQVHRVRGSSSSGAAGC